MTSIEHGYALDDELRAEMVARGQYLVPTLLETTQDLDPARTSPSAYEKGVRWHRIAQESVARSASAGVRMAMGTDSGLAVGHGRNLQELGLLVDIAGLTPMEAIVAATGDAARLCGVEEVTGTLVAGRAADLVVTDVDPLSDIASLGEPAHILAVVKEGRIAVDRAGCPRRQRPARPLPLRLTQASPRTGRTPVSSRRSCSTSRPSGCPRPRRCCRSRTRTARRRRRAARCR